VAKRNQGGGSVQSDYQLTRYAWQLTATVQEHQQFRRNYLPVLDKLMVDASRQLWLGE
jgi:hypothetical protein